MSGVAVSLDTRLGDFRLQVDFVAPERGITVLFGHSGSGKTSVLRAVAGLVRASNGTIRLNDEVWQDQRRFLPTHARPIGYVFQEASLFPHLSVRRNLEYGWKRVPTSERRITLDDAIGLLGIEPLLPRNPNSLSGGERQRVAIARALVTSPRLLLMDEPLAALDHGARQAILPYLERLHGELEIPSLYVSHEPDEVARLADHMVVMNAGKVHAQGPAAELLTRLDLPLARFDTASAIIEGEVGAHDEKYHLTWIKANGSRFVVPREDLAVGRPARVQIRARDVSLSLSAHTDTSILNIVPAQVRDIQDLNPTQLMVRLALEDGQTLLSRITQRSGATLGLHEGQWVYAQVKSVALLG